MTAAVTEPRWTVPHQGEVFRFLFHAWDVAKAWDLVKDAEPSGHLNVADTARNAFGARTPADLMPQPIEPGKPRTIYAGIHVDTDWCLANDLDLDRPLLIVRAPVPSGDTVTMMIDGHHRLWRAWHDGVETLPGILLTAEQEQACRIR